MLSPVGKISVFVTKPVYVADSDDASLQFLVLRTPMLTAKLKKKGTGVSGLVLSKWCTSTKGDLCGMLPERIVC